MASKKYIITSAQACYHINEDGDELPWGVPKNYRGRAKAIPNYNFLNGLDRIAKDYGAEMIIQPIAGKNVKEDILHEDLQNRKDIFWGDKRKLNDNIQIRDIVVPPQNVDPATGKSELVGEYNSSLIFPHTKQRFFPVPVFNADLPRYIYTSGAITMPNYNVANHRGDTAERNHVFGALLLEVLDDKFYNITNLRALKNGKFVDRGKLYDGNLKPKKIEVDFMVVGDYHFGSHDEKAVKATYEMIEKFHPKRIFLHDFFDGHSINHHEKDNSLMRVREYKRGRLSLEEELKSDYEEIIKLSKIARKNTEIYVVSSNHHAFLPRYINEKNWINGDLWNADICSYLFNQATLLDIPEKEIDDAAYLIEEGMKRFGQIPSNIKFLRLKDNFRRFGIQLASHGDKGSNGSRGGKAKSKATIGGGKSVTGHIHTMEIYGYTYVIGTNGLLDAPHTAGFGNACIAANCLGYSNGLMQMLPIIEGEWMNFKL
ncbi:hypothetical protein M0R19_03000 [Candidatus Pacearchaeota archaeon]|jgi:hypothetical protein|nr:hypothetical protein [Candidatus Pacearchaeota archaeon]